MDDLTNHKLVHKLIRCGECSQDVREDQMELHLQNHKNFKKFTSVKVDRKNSSSSKSSTLKRKVFTAYTVWQAEERKKIARENKNMLHTEVSSELGRRWKQLGEQEKAALKIKAAELNVRLSCFNFICVSLIWV